jgi:hypothetical protein
MVPDGRALRLEVMKETQAYIERIKRVSRDYQRLELAVDSSLLSMRAGQAVLSRRIEKDYEIQNWNPYLRELWFPVEIQDSNIIVIERPAREEFVPGQLLSLIGPVGNPFRFRRKLRNILLIAYDTPPAPLLLMLPALLSNQVSVTMILMGSAREYDSEHLPEEIEILHAEEDLSWPDMVMTLGWADQVFALVGEGNEVPYFEELMRLVRGRRADIPDNYIFGVFQRQLPCGVGACCACMLRARDGAKLQCIDGPAFDLTALRLD